MRSFVIFLFGLIVGLLVVAGFVWMKAPGMMIHEKPSPVGLDETVERITRTAKADGWAVQSIIELEKSIKKNGGGDVKPIRLVNLCQAQHAFKLMSQDDIRPLSVFLPCTISVYEKTDGKTYVASMNAELFGKLMGGLVAEVMGEEVAESQEKFVNAVDLPTPAAPAEAPAPTDAPSETPESE